MSYMIGQVFGGNKKYNCHLFLISNITLGRNHDSINFDKKL